MMLIAFIFVVVAWVVGLVSGALLYRHFFTEEKPKHYYGLNGMHLTRAARWRRKKYNDEN